LDQCIFVLCFTSRYSFGNCVKIGAFIKVTDAITLKRRVSLIRWILLISSLEMINLEGLGRIIIFNCTWWGWTHNMRLIIFSFETVLGDFSTWLLYHTTLHQSLIIRFHLIFLIMVTPLALSTRHTSIINPNLLLIPLNNIRYISLIESPWKVKIFLRKFKHRFIKALVLYLNFVLNKESSEWRDHIVWGVDVVVVHFWRVVDFWATAAFGFKLGGVIWWDNIVILAMNEESGTTDFLNFL